ARGSGCSSRGASSKRTAVKFGRIATWAAARASISPFRWRWRREFRRRACCRSQIPRSPTRADILIIDDDIESAEVLAELMRAEGHTVRIGYNGQDGFDLAREHVPELALIDIDMPLLDGPGMTYEMFLHDMGLEDVPVAFLSGSPQIRDVAARVG